MSIAEERVGDPEAGKAEWLDQLNDLLALVEGWSEASGWRTRRTTKPVTEPGLGRYDVPLLLVERGDVEFVFSPLARTGSAAGGVVDLYRMPGYDDVVRLAYEGGRWYFRSFDHPESTARRFVIPVPIALDGHTMRFFLDAAATDA
jgi:hypothetical protein